MADERDGFDKDQGTQKHSGQQPDGQSQTDDLEARPEDVEKVKGGRMLSSSDPCEGGEIFRQ